MRGMMNPLNAQKTALERAFEIARQGRCAGIEDIRRQLGREGYNQRQLIGRALARQLCAIAREARAMSQEDA